MGFASDTDLFSEMPACQLDGISLPTSSRRVTGGRAIVGRKYPNRDGQSSEDLGREPYTFELEIWFFEGVHPNHWPNLWNQLRAKLEDPPENMEYIDHELGSMRVSVQPGWTSDMDAMKRNGVIVRLTLIEDSLDTTLDAAHESPSQSQDTPEHAGVNVDHELEEAGVTDTQVHAALRRAGLIVNAVEQALFIAPIVSGTFFRTVGANFTAWLRADAWTRPEIQVSVDAIAGAVDAVLAFSELRNPSTASATSALVLFLYACTNAGNLAARNAPLLVEHIVRDGTNIFTIAAELYGDERRVEELMRMNLLPNPLFIPAGTRLIVMST